MIGNAVGIGLWQLVTLYRSTLGFLDLSRLVTARDGSALSML